MGELLATFRLIAGNSWFLVTWETDVGPSILAAVQSEGASGHSSAVRLGQPGRTALTKENIETLPVVR